MRHPGNPKFVERGKECRIVTITSVGDELIGHEDAARAVLDGNGLPRRRAGNHVGDASHMPGLIGLYIQVGRLQPSEHAVVQTVLYQCAELPAAEAVNFQRVGERQDFAHVKNTDRTGSEARTDTPEMAAADNDFPTVQIGRASCRERVSEGV